MKQIYPVIILIIAAGMYGAGALFRITHAPNAAFLLLLSKIIGGIGAILLIYSLAADKGKKK